MIKFYFTSADNITKQLHMADSGNNDKYMPLVKHCCARLMLGTITFYFRHIILTFVFLSHIELYMYTINSMQLLAGISTIILPWLRHCKNER